MLPEERDNEQLGIILRYCGRIDRALARHDASYERFCEDEVFQDSCSLCLIQIGEAVNRLSPAYKANHGDIPWQRIYGMRCHLVHGYESFDAEIVWDALHVSIPELRRFCETHFNPSR